MMAHAAVLTLMPAGPIEVPMREGLGIALFPLVVALAPALVGLACFSAMPQVEGRSPFLRRARALWWLGMWAAFALVGGVVAVATGASPVVGYFGEDGSALTVTALSDSAVLVALRNISLVMAISSLTLVRFGRDSSWAPALLLLGISAVFGTDPRTGDAEAWALLQRPATEPAPLLITVALTALAWGLYSWRDAAR
ncbi:hypothetical protein BJY21_003965 [Kineosphaera limosa]|nr:hypothetical protein [Kineosphaera limosa]NYE02781.1 hypothetical protein [Kineosphaera limosa]